MSTSTMLLSLDHMPTPDFLWGNHHRETCHRWQPTHEHALRSCALTPASYVSILKPFDHVDAKLDVILQATELLQQKVLAHWRYRIRRLHLSEAAWEIRMPTENLHRCFESYERYSVWPRSYFRYWRTEMPSCSARRSWEKPNAFRSCANSRPLF